MYAVVGAVMRCRGCRGDVGVKDYGDGGADDDYDVHVADND